MALHNLVNNRLLKEKLHSNQQDRATLSFYKYHHIQELELFRNDLYRAWQELDVLGRTFVAEEGINAQISVPNKNQEAFKEHLYSIPFLDGIRLNWAVDDNGKSFFKLRVAIKKKIVADGINDPNFDVTR